MPDFNSISNKLSPQGERHHSVVLSGRWRSGRGCPPSNFPEGVLFTGEITRRRTRLAFYPRVQKTKRLSPSKERNLTMQHLSRRQLKNKLPIDASIWNTVRTNFKLRRLLYTILFWIGKAENTDIGLSQLNSNWELKWLCNCWQTVASENKHIALTKHQSPCFSLILQHKKHQQVEGNALFNSVQFM